MKFFRSDSAEGKSLVYAFNADPQSSAVVTVPNSSDGDGVTYIIRPTEKIPFGEADSSLVSPLTEVIAGPTAFPGVSGGGKSLFKLAFSRLTFGNVVNVGSFRLSCTTTQLVIVTTGITINGLGYFWINSNKGISTTNQNSMPPVTQHLAENEYHFDIDFASLGYDIKNDILEGNVTFETTTSEKALTNFSKTPSVPLHPAEKEFFARLARGEL